MFHSPEWVLIGLFSGLNRRGPADVSPRDAGYLHLQKTGVDGNDNIRRTEAELIEGDGGGIICRRAVGATDNGEDAGHPAHSRRARHNIHVECHGPVGRQGDFKGLTVQIQVLRVTGNAVGGGGTPQHIKGILGITGTLKRSAGIGLLRIVCGHRLLATRYGGIGVSGEIVAAAAYRRVVIAGGVLIATTYRRESRVGDDNASVGVHAKAAANKIAIAPADG